MAAPSTVKKPSRFGLFLPFILLLVAAAGWSAWWYIAAGRIERAVDRWIADQRAAGVEIGYESREFGGYPFRFELAFDRPVVTDRARALTWQGERIELVMQAWDLTHIIGRVPGHNVIAGADGLRNSIDLDGHAAFSLSWNGAGLHRFGLQSGEAEALIGGSLYKVSGLSLNLAPRPESPDDLMVALQWDKLGLDAAPAEAPYLGTDLGPSRLIGEVRGFFPAYEANGRSVPGLWDRLLAGGGGVEVAQLLLDWGPLDLGAKANLDLAGGAANGSIDVRIDKADGLKQAMIDAGRWGNGEKLALGTLQAASADNGFLKLTVLDNKVFVEPFLLWQLPDKRS